MAASARLIICLWICLTATVHAATRVALVSTCGGDAAGNVLALAEAKLAATTNIVLVERAQVERILNEQKLVRCGLSDSAQALAVGKLLGVEVFATLETFPGSQEMLGLVVFDARSGAKLWDAALPGGGVNVTAEALVEAVREACEKRLRSVGNRRTVCLLSVRNAELPRAMDSFCESVGRLLERGLVGSASLAVLERERLEQINRERALPTAEPSGDLLPSLTLLVLEFSRGSESNEVKATVFLTDASGSSLGKIQAAGSVEQAGDLTELLLRKLIKSLDATPAAHAVDRWHEAQRFQQEARFFIEHMQFAKSLQAAEAAYALNPSDKQLRRLLADALFKAARDILAPGQPETSSWASRTASDDLKRALGLGHRGADLCLEIRAEMPPGRIAHFNSSTEEKTFALFLRLARNVRDGYEEESRRQLAELQAKYRRILVEFWLRPTIAADRTQSLSMCCPGSLYWLINEIEFGSVTSKGWTADAVEVLDDWLTLLDKRGFCNIKPEAVNWMLTQILYRIAEPSRRYEGCYGQCWSLTEADLMRLRSFFNKLGHRQESLLQLYSMASEFAEVVGKEHGKGSAVANQLAQILGYGRQSISSPPCGDSDDYHVATYQALLDTIDLVPDVETRRKGYQELFDFMLQRGEYVHWVAMAAVDPQSQIYAAYQHMGSVFPRQKEAVISKGDPKVCAQNLTGLLAMLESPDCRRISVPARSWRGSLDQQLAQLRDTLAAQGADVELTQEPPWTAARLLYTGPTALLQPHILGDSVWGLELVGEKLRLVRVPLDGEPAQRYDRIPPHGPPDKFYCAIARDKVVIFPSDTAAVNSLTESNGLPSSHISAVAYCDGKLHAGIGSNSGYQGTAGYLIACDLATGRIATLASSLRKEKLSALDGVSPPFFIRQMAADPLRHRVLFTVDIGIYNEGTSFTGLWSVNTSDGKLTQLFPLAEACEWVSEIRGNEILLACRHWGKNSRYKVLSFNLETNTSRLLGASEWSDADRPAPSEDRVCRLPFGAGSPHLILDDWLWVARPFSRSLIAGRSHQFLPSFIEQSSFNYFYRPRYFGLLERRRQLLVGVGNQLWLLDLKPTQPVAAKDQPAAVVIPDEKHE